MNHPTPQCPTQGRAAPHPWVSQPRPAVRPERCAYCNEAPPTVLCGPEHTAYAGEWLCPCCYAQLFEGAVLFARNEASHV